MPPKMSAYRIGFDETKQMPFLIRIMNFLDEYNKVWNKFSKFIKKGSDSEPVYNDKYFKTKEEFHEGKINRNFHDNKVPKEDSLYICLLVILIDSIFRTCRNYYCQVF